jgi:hypothetical protein
MRSILDNLKPPSRLQFRLRGFNEHASTDEGLQGTRDEVYLSAIGSDSSSVTLGPAGKPQIDLIHTPSIGRVSSDEVRGPWREKPFVLVDFDLKKAGDWPRSYTVTLLLVEHDNADVAEAFNKLHSEVGDTIKEVAVKAASTAAAALAGAAIGSVIPGIGTAVGAAVGALAGAAYDTAIAEIEKGLANEVFKPIPITLEIQKPWLSAMKAQNNIDTVLTHKVVERGADYDIIYDWHIVL